MEEQTTSPVVKAVNKSETMTFPEAIAELIKGKYIARVEWDNSDYCLMKDGYLMIYVNDVLHKWIVQTGDLESQDWKIIQNAN